MSIQQLSTEQKGLALGLVAVIAFGLTLPMTRIALAAFDPVFISFGRACLAGVIAALLLLCTQSKRLTRRQLGACTLVALCVVLGFPLLSALAMQTVPASHGGVVLAILPLITACVATVISDERPSVLFWVISVIGACVVVVFSLRQGGGHLMLADAFLFLAVIAAAIGYAVGAQLAKELKGWRVICWSLVISLPFTLPISIVYLPSSASLENLPALAAFLYLALMSQLLGFFLWYKGLALGGIARVSQTQLLQPFVTLLAATTLANEHLDASTAAFASIVVVIVWVGRKAIIKTKSTQNLHHV